MVLLECAQNQAYFPLSPPASCTNAHKKRAIVAFVRSILTAIYHMLSNGVLFEDLGADYYNSFNKERKINLLLSKLTKLG